jgi:hypothetical protein
MQINFHKRTGIKPGFGFIRESYKLGQVFGIRLWWAALTISFSKVEASR